MLAEFESGDGASGRTEEERLEKFCDQVNSKIEEVKARKRAITKDFEKWKKEKQLSNRVGINWVSHRVDDLTLERQKLEIGSYYAWLDPHAYVTDNYFWGALLTSCACGGAGK